MSEIPGPLTALAHAIVDPIEQHRRLPPDKQILAQVSLAAHLLGWCLYLCPLFKTGPFTCVFRGKSATDSGMKSATDSDLISAIPI